MRNHPPFALLGGLFLASLLVSGCSGTAAPTPQTAQTNTTAISPSAASTPDATTPSATPTPAPETPKDATAWAKAIKQPTTKKIVTVTEDNDPNDLFGRPNGYTDGAVMYDSRVRCSKSEFGVDCGVFIEVWPDAESAKDRATYIQKLGKKLSFLSEYDETAGPVLLRLSGKLKPSQAKAYINAFKAIGA